MLVFCAEAVCVDVEIYRHRSTEFLYLRRQHKHLKFSVLAPLQCFACFHQRNKLFCPPLEKLPMGVPKIQCFSIYRGCHSVSFCFVFCHSFQQFCLLSVIGLPCFLLSFALACLAFCVCSNLLFKVLTGSVFYAIIILLYCPLRLFALYLF